MRNPRLYGLYLKPKSGRRAGRFVRLFPKRAYVKATAIRVFQSVLLATFFRGKPTELRPVR